MAVAAEKAAAEQPDQVEQALGKVGDVIDKQTGGSYHDYMAKGSQKAEEYLDKQARPGI